MKAASTIPGARLRIVLEPEIVIGPGKADLLQGIEETGSIAAAGRQLGMSYKKAWRLVDGMNTDFRPGLVATSKGGRTRGGAKLTDLGKEVLSLYRSMEDRAADAIEDELHTLRRLLRHDVT